MTVIAALPLFVSLVAVTVVDPAATPVTRPLPFTVATAGVPLTHVTARPVRAPPAESFGVALSCTVAPTSILAVLGLTVTDATGTSDTVMPALALWPSTVAVTVAVPALTPRATPLVLTVAIAGLLLAQLTTRPASVFPAESCAVAASCTVWPVNTLAELGLTLTDATGTAVTVTSAVSDCEPG